jgi:hypothetical protein
MHPVFLERVLGTKGFFFVGQRISGIGIPPNKRRIKVKRWGAATSQEFN